MKRFARHSVGISALALASSLAMTRPARAQSTTSTRTTDSGATVRSSHDWYGPTTFLVYGIGYAAVGAGLGARQASSQGVRFVGTIVFSAGIGTALFGVPFTHWGHDELGKGFVSLGGQFGALVAGGVVGYGVSGGDQTGMFVGAGAGHLVFAVADSLFLAHHERVLSVETGALRFSVVPDGLGAALRMTH